MFSPRQRERDRDRAEVTIEGVKERLSEPIDFTTVILQKLAYALSSHNTRHRNQELNDIEDLLAPYHDEEFKREMDRLEKEGETWNNAKEPWGKPYLRGRLRIITRLMKRNDLLPKGMI